MTASGTRWTGPSAVRHELGITAELTELAKVRHWVRAVLSTFPANVVSTAVMVVDELTSNALRHGHAPFHVRLLPGAARLRIEVDDGAREPARRRAPSDQGGRGLLLVERCAAAWGQLRRPGGKTLWAELPTDPGPAGARG
ncbi:MAG TPA: ATP-binding protein [Amycolatopsis sp.]|uniref:ATP-binding protein n=1 Tax=Amycolatopsis nalaikhensis TaxID=715472 RepID=A0ABY8XG64_9PSEU|nr:ATP-binding protein [Amycolatopsis sp. 2-2]WIV54635.1 ATP-binding protein [Amycolatopsis sp. 2-2]